jgi:hypothetical protein
MRIGPFGRKGGPFVRGPATEWVLENEGVRLPRPVVFAGVPDLAFIDVSPSFGQDVRDHRQIDIMDLPAGRKRATVDTRARLLTAKDNTDADLIDVSPDGTKIVLRTDHYGPTWAVVSTEERKPLLVDWSPSSRAGKSSADCSWLFTDRLLVLCTDGSVDAWTIPGLERQPLIAADSSSDENHRVAFATSHDRESLACWRGKGLELFGLPTGRPLRAMEAVNLEGRSERVRAKSVVFRPDNKQVAVLLGLGEVVGPSTIILAVWDVATGRKVMQVVVPQEKANTLQLENLTWWGNRHILVRKGLIHKEDAPLVEVPSGAMVCWVRHTGHLAVQGRSSDGRLWCAYRLDDSGTSTWMLQSFDFPADDVRRCKPAPSGQRPLSVLEVGDKGIEVK